MKTSISLLLVLLSYCLSGQTIELTTAKTSTLVFPFSITHVDRGNSDLLVQPIPADDHVLLVKAGSEEMPATNLTVVTKDGAVYSLPVKYVDSPFRFIYHMHWLKDASPSFYANLLLNQPFFYRGVHASGGGMQYSLAGTYTRNNVVFFQMQIENASPIDYEPEWIRLFIRDKGRLARTASQEVELKPLYVAGNTSLVQSHSKNIIVIALEKYALADDTYLAVEIAEKKGGRKLLLKIQNRYVLHAKELVPIH